MKKQPVVAFGPLHTYKRTDLLGNNKLGAASELTVAAELLRRGYEVFRSVAWQAGCDLVAVQNNRLCRVEVKTARLSPKGTLNGGGNYSQSVKHDVEALVLPEGERIEFRPEIDHWFKNQRRGNL